MLLHDQCNHCISVFKCDGNFIHSIGQSDQLNHPFDVAVNSNNQLIVANGFNSCISIFTLEGIYISEFGKHGHMRGDLSGLIGLTIDRYGYIFITESGIKHVLIFDKDGVFVHCFGHSNVVFGMFYYGIALSPNGSVYVSDMGNKEIHVFSKH